MNGIRINNIRLLFAVFTIIWGILIVFIVRDTEMTSSPEILEQNRVTVNIKTEILARALDANASDKYSYNNAILGDFTISSNKSAKFTRIFLTDSIAARTARNYPHLFQYTEDGDEISFKMKKYTFEGYVVVPVWLLEALLENNILTINH
jgi:hypothetical protein